MKGDAFFYEFDKKRSNYKADSTWEEKERVLSLRNMLIYCQVGYEWSQASQ